MSTVGQRVRIVRRSLSPDPRAEPSQGQFADRMNEVSAHLFPHRPDRPHYDQGIVSRLENNQRKAWPDDIAIVAFIDPLDRGKLWLGWGEQPGEEATKRANEAEAWVESHGAEISDWRMQRVSMEADIFRLTEQTELLEARLQHIDELLDSDQESSWPIEQHIIARADAVRVLQQALKDEGRMPEHHRAIMRAHREVWPTLWKAIDRIVQVQAYGGFPDAAAAQEREREDSI